MSLSWNIFSSWGRVLFALVYFYLSNFWEFAFWLLMSCSPGWGDCSVFLGTCGNLEAVIVEWGTDRKGSGGIKASRFHLRPFPFAILPQPRWPLWWRPASARLLGVPQDNTRPLCVLFLCLEALCLPLTLPTLQGGAVLRKAFPPWATHSSPCPPGSQVPARIAPSGLHEHHHCYLPYLKQPHRW